MNKLKLTTQRRDFLKAAGLTSLSFMIPGFTGTTSESPIPSDNSGNPKNFSLVNFASDGLQYSPEEYLETLLTLNQSNPIHQDYYGQGGATEALATQFAKITGKEKAIFLPTGTMANELAIKLLSGDKTKIIVPENSHIFRDEADAAFTVHHKRLIPVGKGDPYFTLEELKDTIDYYKKGEVFKSDVGTVSVENPVRRANGTAVPLENIQAITEYCQKNGLKTHLDGARIHIASAYTGIPVKEYVTSFDTVYISLYKYLNAAFGGILCGPAELIDQIPHQSKIHGGAAFQTWVSSAMASHHLLTIEDDLKKAKIAGEKLIPKLNALPGLTLSTISEGTNIYKLQLDEKIDFNTLNEKLHNDFDTTLRNPNPDGKISFYINASILRRPVEEIVYGFEEALKETIK